MFYLKSPSRHWHDVFYGELRLEDANDDDDNDDDDDDDDDDEDACFHEMFMFSIRGMFRSLMWVWVLVLVRIWRIFLQNYVFFPT